MDLGRAARMVSQRGFLHEEAMRDVQWKDEMRMQMLSRIKNQALTSIRKDEVWNREELTKALGSIVQETGNFVCLLGGKSTGKSLLLEDLGKRHRGKVFVVDLRLHGSFLGGLLRVLPQHIPPKTFYTIVADIIAEAATGMVEPLSPMSQAITEKLASADEVAQGMTGAEIESVSMGLVELLRDTHCTKNDRPGPLRIVFESILKELGPVTIVVDEANIAFDIKSGAGSDDIKETRAALEFFTQFTKQRLKGNVVLVSTEHAFPYGLSRKEVGFSLSNFTAFLYAGELAPKDMHQLLVKEWGVGRHLSWHIMEVMTYLALGMLRHSKDEAWRVGLNPLKTAGVQDCLDWRPKEQADLQRGRIREVLRLLAIKGFAPIPNPNDKVAEVISRNNVAGIVKGNSFVEGLPSEAWGDADYGLVPATQSMRLAIAEEVVAEASSTSDVEATTA